MTATMTPPPAERPPIDLDSVEGIQRTYEYFRDLESDRETSLRVYRSFAVALHPKQLMSSGTKEAIQQNRELGGRLLWLPDHWSNVDPLVEGAAAYRNPYLNPMVGKSSIFTKPDWYQIPIVGRGIRQLYDTAPAIPLSRNPNKELRDLANDTAIDTMAFRMIEKGEDGVMYPTRHRVTTTGHELPPSDEFGLGPQRIARALQEKGIRLRFLVTGRWLGKSALTQHTVGTIKPVLVHSVIDVPPDLDDTRAAIRRAMQLNVAKAKAFFDAVG
jgi:hypothetical protein